MLALAALVAFSACGKKKRKKKEEVTEIKTLNNSVEVSLPFESKEYRSDKENFRAKGSGKSPDLATSKKIAMLNAKSELAGNIESVIKRVTEQYTNQRSVSNKQEYENKFEELAKEVVKQTLVDVRILGEKTYKDPDNSFTSWVAIEVSKADIMNGVNNRIAKDAKLQLDYDKMKFEKNFNEEMEKLERQQ